ncbi:MAG: putative secreted serine (or cysteine) proteinase inhibitor, clade (ovalbumin), er [Myxococcaceae bacterium]|nr:putative secreted serine (or cysteine) proteinase inhibitor, clade (ovalbumin), er [Myxococcaceae bacterium]
MLAPLLAVLGLAASSACGDESHPAAPEAKLAKSALSRLTTPSTADVSSLGASNSAFAFDLYHQIATHSANENLLFSPYSISSAFAMTYAGARGATESELKTALHFDLGQAGLHEAFNATDLALASRGQGKAGADGTPFKLHIDNALWAGTANSVLPTYLDTLAVNYGAGVFVVPFSDPDAARAVINGWVSDQTEKLIPELLPVGSITARTDLVLTNTVYLDASWQSQFEPSRTHDADFTKSDGTKVKAAMMNAMLSAPYFKGNGFSAVALPYADDRLRMVAILPDEGKLQTIEDALDADWFATLAASLSPQQLALSLPKLDYRATTDLIPALKALGVHDAFELGLADFSAITGSRGMGISGVFHQAALEASEAGTIAAAATAVVFAHKSADVASGLPLTFDRPFFLAIVDQPTDTILFLGRVLDPTAP